MPPDDDEVSDEDSEAEDDVLPKDLNHMGKGILSQIAEMDIYDKEEDLPDVMTVTVEDELEDSVYDETAGEPSKGRVTRGKKRKEMEMEEDTEETVENEQEEVEAGTSKLNRVHNKDRIWKKKKPAIFGMSVPEFSPQPLKPVPADCKTPYDFHKLFFDDSFVNMLVHRSKLYSIKKNRPEAEARINNDSMRVSVAIMHMTGYLTPANRDMYWEQRPDTENMFVRDAMSKNTFSHIIRNTVFVDSDEPDKDDRFWKVRPLFTQLNRTAKTFVRQNKNVSIDEGIIKYFGPHPLKQYMKGKPHRFGYKVWMLATAEGELLACQPYGGASTKIPDYGLGQGPNVVLGLSEQFGLAAGSQVRFEKILTQNLLFLLLLFFLSFFTPQYFFYRSTWIIYSRAWTCWTTWGTVSLV